MKSDRMKLLKEELILLLESMDNDRLAAFYSEPSVVNILDTLYKRWEESSRASETLDYATERELSRLLSIAKRIIRLQRWEARRFWLSRYQ